MVILEQIIRLFQRKQTSRVVDMIINIGSSMLYAVLRLEFLVRYKYILHRHHFIVSSYGPQFYYRVFLLGLVVTAFVYVYTNYRLVTLPINSLWTWALSILLVELAYYWTHRAFHEINILWATHQYHHMAEDISVTTAIRNSVVDLIFFDVSSVSTHILILIKTHIKTH